MRKYERYKPYGFTAVVKRAQMPRDVFWSYVANCLHGGRPRPKPRKRYAQNAGWIVTAK